MSLKRNQAPQSFRTRLGLAVGGTGLLAIAACGGHGHTANSTGGEASSSTAPATGTAAKKTVAHFEAPTPNGHLYNTRHGFDVVLDVTALKRSDKVFLGEMTPDDGDKDWTIDGEPNPTPIADHVGTSKFFDSEVGNPGDEDSAELFVAITADPACATRLENKKPHNGDYTVPVNHQGGPVLGEGCAAIALTGALVTWGPAHIPQTTPHNS